MIIFQNIECIGGNENRLKDDITDYLSKNGFDINSNIVVSFVSHDPLDFDFDAIAISDNGKTLQFKGRLDGSYIQ